MHSQPVRDISILRVGRTELKLGPSTILQPSADWVILTEGQRRVGSVPKYERIAQLAYTF